VTVICPLANSYLQSATAGAVAELAATRKVAKYSTLEDQYIFQPIAVEADFSQRILCVSGDDRETTFLFEYFLFCYFVSILFCCTTVSSWTNARKISLSIVS